VGCLGLGGLGWPVVGASGGQLRPVQGGGAPLTRGRGRTAPVKAEAHERTAGMGVGRSQSQCGPR
jgi:hypothetical protein